jgi:putative ABC transport system permease protein
MFKQLLRGARYLFRRNAAERELDAELRYHIERQTELNVQRGMSAQDARRAAIVKFGGVEGVKEECRDERGGRLVEELLQDVRYGLRVLRRNPGYTAAAVFTLALGIGANTAIFSVVNGVLLRPLPYGDGERLVLLRQQAPRADIQDMRFSVKEVEDYRTQSRTLAGVEEYHQMNFTLLGLEEPERVRTGVVSAGYFDMLGVRPILGRAFQAEDDKRGADAVLVLSNEFWQRKFAGDPSIVGRPFRMNDRVHTVIGVLPPLPVYPDENDVYMPTSACPTRSSDQFCDSRTARMMRAVARLEPGVGIEEARADLGAIAAGLKSAYPDSYPEARGYANSVSALRDELTSAARPRLLVLLATVALVLLIACANVANLTLSRMVRREREIAVRSALGARRSRLARQVLTESALLSLAGGALGLVIASSGLSLLVAFAARFTPRANEIAIDGTVLLFTLVVSLVTGLVFGAIPVLTDKMNPMAALKGGTGGSAGAPGRHRLRGALVVAQVAFAFVLLIGAGLMARSFVRLQQVSPGFNPERVLTMSIPLNWSKYDTPEKYTAFFRTTLDRVQVLPGVTSVALSTVAPMASSTPFRTPFRIEGRPQEESDSAPPVDLRVVSKDYFKTVGLPLVKGRTFEDRDRLDAPEVAVVNQTLARHRWPGDDPIGKRVSADNGQTWVEIVGVVGDVRQYGLDKEPADEIYASFDQTPTGSTLLVRTTADPSGIEKEVRAVIRDVDHEQPIVNVRTLEQVVSESLAPSRLTMLLLSLFAVLALAITIAGIAGVMALWVGQRTNEIGIRMALGATPFDVVGLVMRQGLGLVVIGLVIGLVGAVALSTLLSGLLFGTEVVDPATYVGVSLVLLGAAAAACFLPARRATAIDPILALRAD